eukprot:5286982-Alexandrium_andersonii.AAC.1
MDVFHTPSADGALVGCHGGIIAVDGQALGSISWDTMDELLDGMALANVLRLEAFPSQPCQDDRGDGVVSRAAGASGSGSSGGGSASS